MADRKTNRAINLLCEVLEYNIWHYKRNEPVNGNDLAHFVQITDQVIHQIIYKLLIAISNSKAVAARPAIDALWCVHVILNLSLLRKLDDIIKPIDIANDRFIWRAFGFSKISSYFEYVLRHVLYEDTTTSTIQCIEIHLT